MITRVEIDGFKTFRDFKLELAPLQVIVGPNGAGKSNLSDALEPKQQLSHVLQQALASRTRRYRRRRHISELYEPLARQMSLQGLAQVSAYQQFVDNLSKALVRLNFVR